MGLTRGVPPAMMAAITAGGFHPAILVDLDWPGGAVQVHSGLGSLRALGRTWRGVGRFGAIEVPAEASGMVATRTTLTLLGVPPDVYDLLDAPVRNRPGEVLFGVAAEAGGNTLVSDPVIMFAGYMDAMRYTIQPDGKDLQHAIQLELGSGPEARSLASVVHSAEDQKRRWPADTAGRHLMNSETRAVTMTWPE